jgi:Ca2+-dependent lipid-binding protein
VHSRSGNDVFQGYGALQVLEARGLLPKDFSGKSDPYVLVSYNKHSASTKTVYKSLSPVFGDVILFQESRHASTEVRVLCR